jgi:glycosyltransferase involved in cell wall biosynthesis
MHYEMPIVRRKDAQTMSDKITIIIPTFDRGYILPRAIQSVLNQTVQNFEICIYDNASTDQTKMIVDEFKKTDRRIKYFRHKKNIGMMRNYQFAFSRIKTKYYQILSDDDFILPWFFETALSYFDRYPKAAFFSGATVVMNEDGNLESNPTGTWGKFGYLSPPEGAYEMVNHFLLPPGVLFQTAQTKRVKPDYAPAIQPRWDSDYLLRISMQKPYVYVPILCAVFFAHSGGFSTSHLGRGTSQDDGSQSYLSSTEALMRNIEEEVTLTKQIKVELLARLRQRIKAEIYGRVNVAFKVRDPDAAANFIAVMGHFSPLSYSEKIKMGLSRLAAAHFIFNPLFGGLAYGLSLLALLRTFWRWLRSGFKMKCGSFHHRARYESDYEQYFNWAQSSAADYALRRTGIKRPTSRRAE